MDECGYVTDGKCLYEVLSVRIEPGRKEQRNAGIMGGITSATPDRRFYTIQNCATQYVWEEMDADAFAKFKPVEPDPEHAVELLHADFARWEECAPAWLR